MSAFSVPTYFRKYGSAEKIQSMVDCYLKNIDNCSSEEIEKLLYTNLSEFTLTAIIEYINKNPDLYLNYRTRSENDRKIKQLCDYYNKNKSSSFFTLDKNENYQAKEGRMIFKQIKCIWVFYELLKKKKEHKQKGNTSVMTVEENQKVNLLISQKIERLREKIFDRCVAEITIEEYKDALGISDIDNLLVRNDGGMGKKRTTNKRKMRKFKRTRRRR